jgi:hypothetical protein
VVSHSHRGRARRRALVAAGALALIAGASGAGFACSRQQNLVDEPDSGSTVTAAPSCDAGVPEVPDSGIASEELVLCADRPLGDCQGSNDFPCEFEFWFQQVVTACQNQAACPASGCVEATTGEDGCVNAIGMSEPNPDFVACLVEQFGAYRCPCGVTSARRFIGVGASGCHRPCGTGEHICPAGETCVDGFCEPSGAGGGG